MESTTYVIDGKEFELKHYGVKGMKWGRRKARPDYASQARTARESASEWDEMAKYAEQRGNARKAAKYRANAARDRADASAYERQAGPKKSTRASVSNPKKTAATGKKAVKKTMKKVAQSTVKGSAKAASVGMQAIAHMVRVNTAYNTAGYIFDDIYR